MRRKLLFVLPPLLALLSPMSAQDSAQEKKKTGPRPASAQPVAVKPGNGGQPPSDAMVLFDGRNLEGWRTENGGPAKCEVLD